MSFAVAALIVVLFLLAAAYWLNRRIQSSEAMRDRPAGTPGATLPDQAREYLDRLDAELRLPAGDRADIRTEMADHLTDSIAAIEAEGLDEARAVREALARLGNANELARQLRRAHQSTRRALAGVGGGVFEAGVGAAWGLVLGYFLGLLGTLVVALLVSTVLKPPIDFMAARLPSIDTDSYRLATNSAFGLGIVSFACAIAARRGTRTAHLLSRRSLRTVSRVSAAAGSILLGCFVLFVYVAQQTWLTVAVELTIPFAFAAGALFRIDRQIGPRIGKLAAVAIVVIAVALPVGLLMVATVSYSSTGGYSWDMTQQVRAWDRVAPPSGDWQDGPPVSSDSGGFDGESVVEAHYQVSDAAVVGSFHDLHYELWRAIHYPSAPAEVDSAVIPDPAETSAVATQPAVVVDGWLEARLDVSHSRNQRWLLFLVGIGPDGHRYRLNWPDPCFTFFRGTVWDWLTAGS
jgi:hypothetical protein